MAVSIVSFVLSLIDDFTGKDATDQNYAFFVNERIVQPIRKREGYYVFLNIPGEVFRVTVNSGRYLVARTVVSASRIPYEVRMYRNGSYFPDCVYLRGQGDANERISREYPFQPVLKLKELLCADCETQIVLQGYGLRNLSGLRFSLGEKTKKESFLLGDRLTANSYRTIPAMKHRHGEGAELLRCYRTMCDDIGRYCLPIDKNIEEGW